MICCTAVDLPDNPFEFMLLILLGAFVLAAVCLWIQDYIYKITTGKPASERLREKSERARIPLTPAQYRFRLAGYLLITAMFAGLSFSKDYRGWSKLIPLG